MALPLYQGILQYSNEIQRYFHMPGHKQKKELLSPYLADILKLDVTEVTGTDNLHSAEEIILQAQKRAAKLFQAEQTYFLINGTTCGVEASIMAVCNPGDTLLVVRNCHRSVYSGLILGGVRPIFIHPETLELGMPGGIDVKQVQEYLENFPEVKGLIVTSPTYEGFTLDIKNIAKVLHQKNKILIVDEAHGAHLGFDSSFPRSAMQCGADIAIQSSHKTLPALTQSSMLHIQSNRVNISRLQELLAMTQSSSPSYVLMALLDVCREIMEKHGQNRLKLLYEAIQWFKKEITSLKFFKVVELGDLESKGIINQDVSKIVIDVRKTGCSGKVIEERLRKEYQLQVEMSMESYILALTTLADTKKDLYYLFSSLKDLETKIKIEAVVQKSTSIQYPTTSLNILPREAFFSEKSIVNLKESIGKISGEFITPYPPGIPLLIPGELITNEIIQTLQQLIEVGIAVQGKKVLQGQIEILT